MAAYDYNQEKSERGWLESAVVYHIYPLGMLGCELTNCDGERLGVSHRICELESLTVHLVSMGINAIYFGPIFESSTQGYETKD